MRVVGLLTLVSLSFAAIALAIVFGTVRGIVHDPQHRPVAGADVVLKAADSDFTKTATSDGEGQFTFDAIPLGTYSITVSSSGFAAAQQSLTLLSGASPVLHFELQLAGQEQSLTVLAEASPAQA